MEGVPEVQQTNLLPAMQQIENVSQVEQLKLVQNANEHSDLSLLCDRDVNDALSDKEEQTKNDNQVKDNSIHVDVSRQDVHRRSPGRPKKIGVIS